MNHKRGGQPSKSSHGLHPQRLDLSRSGWLRSSPGAREKLKKAFNRPPKQPKRRRRRRARLQMWLSKPFRNHPECVNWFRLASLPAKKEASGGARTGAAVAGDMAAADWQTAIRAVILTLSPRRRDPSP